MADDAPNDIPEVETVVLEDENGDAGEDGSGEDTMKGTKKTVFANFMDLCKTMHRQPEHVRSFLLAELGTGGSLDGQQRLVVKGRFAPKFFESILKKYIREDSKKGTKKTVFANFVDLCKMMHRKPEHVMSFLLAELGTGGSLDEQQRLVVKGRFAPKFFESILRKYIDKYVICKGCKRPDTLLHKENCLFFLQCEQCGSSRSVAHIKAGFVAREGRRKVGA